MWLIKLVRNLILTRHYVLLLYSLPEMAQIFRQSTFCSCDHLKTLLCVKICFRIQKIANVSSFWDSRWVQWWSSASFFVVLSALSLSAKIWRPSGSPTSPSGATDTIFWSGQKISSKFGVFYDKGGKALPRARTFLFYSVKSLARMHLVTHN